MKSEKVRAESPNSKNLEGITLISLVITIILLIILAGIVINLSLGENGIFNKAKYAKIEYEKAKIKEELELEITDVQLEKEGELTYKDISERFTNKGIVLNVDEEDEIQGEYKNYEFLVDENKQVIIGGKLNGEKPTILTGTAISEEDNKIKIQVIASIKNGEIKEIESMNEATLVAKNDNNNHIYEVTTSGIYRFKAIATNGRIVTTKVVIDNEEDIVQASSILEGASKINSSKIKKIKIIENEKEYLVNTIIYEGNMILDGKTRSNRFKLR